MKLITCLMPLLCAFEALAEDPFFANFERDVFPDTKGAEIKRDQLKHLLPTWGFHDGAVPLREGSVDLATVSMLSPAGLKVMTESGIKRIEWEQLSPALVAATGWTPQIRARYNSILRDQTASAVQAASEAMAKARAEAAKQRAAESARPQAAALGPDDYRIDRDPFLKWPENPKKAIRDRAEKRWPNDFEMQEYSIQKETEAYDKMVGYIRNGKAGIPAPVFEKILGKAISDWPDDFGMMVYVTEKEAAAWQRLNP
jgi:hypothetical protein